MTFIEQQNFLRDVHIEVKKAAQRFPQPNPTLAALMEEVGELAKAFLDKEPKENIYKEAVQVAAMAMRCALEGDPQFKVSQ